jgi:hypothetical protein
MKAIPPKIVQRAKARSLRTARLQIGGVVGIAGGALTSKV